MIDARIGGELVLGGLTVWIMVAQRGGESLGHFRQGVTVCREMDLGVFLPESGLSFDSGLGEMQECDVLGSTITLAVHRGPPLNALGSNNRMGLSCGGVDGAGGVGIVGGWAI